MDKLKKCVCIGDSIVNGYPFEREYSWVWLLEERLYDHLPASADPAGIGMVNYGVNGETSSEIRDRFKADALDQGPDCILLSGGTNDFIFTDTGSESVMENLRAMYRMADEEGIPVFLLTPLLTVPKMAAAQWFDGTDYEKVNEKLIHLGEEIRRSGLRSIDLQSDFHACCEKGEIEDWYVDGIHPTKHGYEKIAEILVKDKGFLDRF